MTTLFAQPYDTSAIGFYFETKEEYDQHAEDNCNPMGHPVEEYELQFIDGEDIDRELFEALRLDQANIGEYLDACDDWSEDDKRKVIIAVGECGCRFDLRDNTPADLDVNIYEIESLTELAQQFVDDGLFGDIPDTIINYLDYDAIARDLGCDYTETRVAGTPLVYRCG